MTLLYEAEPNRNCQPTIKGGNMKFLEKGVYKIFGAILLVSMIGALVAEPIAVGDVGYYVGKAIAGEPGSLAGSTIGQMAGEYVGRTSAIMLAELFAEEGAEAGSLAGPVGAVGGAVAGAL